MNFNKRKYYFLPFLDHILAILISLLFTMFFGSWFNYKAFGYIMGIAMTLVMCGMIYSRIWKLSRKNIRYNYGLSMSDCLKFVLPLIIFNIVLILVFCLSKANIIPLAEIITKTYYTFPDNLPRQPVNVTAFDYFSIFTRFWYSYFLGFSQSTNWIILSFSPILILLSAIFGYKMGMNNKEFIDEYAKAVNKAKDKFNE